MVYLWIAIFLIIALVGVILFSPIFFLLLWLWSYKAKSIYKKILLEDEMNEAKKRGDFIDAEILTLEGKNDR